MKLHCWAWPLGEEDVLAHLLILNLEHAGDTTSSG